MVAMSGKHDAGRKPKWTASTSKLTRTSSGKGGAERSRSRLRAGNATDEGEAMRRRRAGARSKVNSAGD